MKKIKSLVDTKIWQYCSIFENPAYLFTQGIKTKNFKTNKLWKTGTKWITNENKWPVSNGNINTTGIKLGEQDFDDTFMICILVSVLREVTDFIDLNRFISIQKLLRITAYVLRFITNCAATHENRRPIELTVD